MEIRVLGAHNVESASTRLTCLLVDGVLAVDAGGLTSGLSLEEQLRVKSVLLTHRHYDHVKDVAALALNLSFLEANVSIRGQRSTLDAISEHFLNGVVYPDFTRVPTHNPPAILCPLEPGTQVEIDGYGVTAVPVNHAAAVGYQITSGEGASFFYTGDTGPGLSSCWEAISPQLLLIDATLPGRLEKHAIASHHLTPPLLSKEMAVFKKVKGYLPTIIAIHVSPELEGEIAGELEQVAKDLGTTITVASEGMRLVL